MKKGDKSKLPKLGKYKVRNSEEIVELDNIYMNNIGVYYGIRRENYLDGHAHSYECGILNYTFWDRFEEVLSNALESDTK